MTLSDPLLKELKGHIASITFSNDNQPLDDISEKVFHLCLCLDKIFTKGLIRHDGFTPWKTDSFQWFYQSMRKYHRTIPLVFKVSFESVLNDPRTKTPVGKARLLIRTCLAKRCLHVPVQLHSDNQDYLDSTLRINYSRKSSIVGHEILTQIFLSLLLQLSTLDFSRLDLTNSSFLDESWYLPTLVKGQIVPCETLGLTLGFPMGFALIVEIVQNSCAAELTHLLQIGDIIDDLNGVSLRNMYGPKIDSLFQKIKSRPFTLTIIKGISPQTQQVYLPIIKLYRILGLDPDSICSSSSISKSRREIRDGKMESINICPPGPDLLQFDKDEQIPAIFNIQDELSSEPIQDPLSHSSSDHSTKTNTNQDMINDSSQTALNLQQQNIFVDNPEQLIV